MAKAQKTAEAETETVENAVSEACNTFLTTGFHLEDLSQLKNLVFAAVKDFKHSGINSWPGWFICSHCGLKHAIDPKTIRSALFEGAGSIDFSATYDEFAAILNGMAVADVGYGELNGFNARSDAEIAHIIDPSLKIEDPSIETETPEIPVSEDEKEVEEEIVNTDDGESGNGSDAPPAQ